MSPARYLAVSLAAAAIAGFALNWLWEMSQMPAYAEMAAKGWGETAIPCGLAALGDVTMTLVVFALVALAAGNPRWAIERRWSCFVAAAALATVVAAGYEWYALASGRWSYTASMPIIPVLGLGLWPLLQLFLLVPAALAIGSFAVRPFRLRSM